MDAPAALLGLIYSKLFLSYCEYTYSIYCLIATKGISASLFIFSIICLGGGTKHRSLPRRLDRCFCVAQLVPRLLPPRQTHTQEHAARSREASNASGMKIPGDGLWSNQWSCVGGNRSPLNEYKAAVEKYTPPGIRPPPSEKRHDRGREPVATLRGGGSEGRTRREEEELEEQPTQKRPADGGRSYW